MDKKFTGHLRGSPDYLFQLHLRSHWKPTGDVTKKNICLDRSAVRNVRFMGIQSELTK